MNVGRQDGRSHGHISSPHRANRQGLAGRAGSQSSTSINERATVLDPSDLEDEGRCRQALICSPVLVSRASLARSHGHGALVMVRKTASTCGTVPLTGRSDAGVKEGTVATCPREDASLTRRRLRVVLRWHSPFPDLYPRNAGIEHVNQTDLVLHFCCEPVPSQALISPVVYA